MPELVGNSTNVWGGFDSMESAIEFAKQHGLTGNVENEFPIVEINESIPTYNTSVPNGAWVWDEDHLRVALVHKYIGGKWDCVLPD